MLALADLLASPDLCKWATGIVAGYIWSLGVGWLVVECLYCCMNRRIDNASKKNDGAPNDTKKREGVPPALTGLIERLVMTTIVVVHPPSAITAMVGWLGLKTAAGWKKYVPDNSVDGKRKDAQRSFLAALCGLLSMFMAGTGGLLATWLAGLHN